MTRFLLKRFSIAVAILLVMSSMLFIFSRTDDPRYQMFSGYISAEQWETLGEELGLNRPLPAQYVAWIAKSMRIDYGDSLQRRTPARGVVLENSTTTLRLLMGSLAFSVIMSTATILAMNYIGERGLGRADVGRWVRAIIPAIPPFIPGILLVHIFFPNSLLFSIVRGGFWGYVLPQITLGVVIAYALVRLFDAARNETANSDCPPENMTTATSSDANGSSQVARHTLLHLLRSSRVYLPTLLSAVIFTEIIFDPRGLTDFILSGTLYMDFPVAASAFMILTMAYVAVMFLLDVARAIVDPLIRSGSSDVSATDSALVAGVQPLPAKQWPLFGRLPFAALAILSIIVFFSVSIPYIVTYSGGVTGLDQLYIMSHEFRYVFLTLIMVLIGAAIIGAAAAFTANRYGMIVDRLLVWIFDLFTSFPILLLGLAGIYSWLTSSVGLFLTWPDPVYLVRAPMYPAGMLAMIASGMFFHQVRADDRMSRGREGVFGRPVVKGLLAVAALSAGPVVMLIAILEVAGIYLATGWAGQSVRAQYALASSIWWTLLAGLVLILTILCLNFLGACLRERLELQPGDPQHGLAEANASVLEPSGK